MMGVILSMVGTGALIIRKWDVRLPLDRQRQFYVLAASVLEGNIIMLLTEGEPGYIRFLLSVIGGSLLLASVTDILLCQVHNFIWWPALAAALILLGIRCFRHCLYETRVLSWDQLLSLVIFVLVQLVVFGRMYGRADSYAFCVCAVAEAAGGMDIMGMLVHMIFAYSILVPMQVWRRNIDKKGNLIQPVPFLPYIVTAFWAVLFWGGWQICG